MNDTVLLSNTIIKEMNQTFISRYIIPTISANDTSGILCLKVPCHKGELHTVRIACLSDKYNINLYTKSKVITPSIYEILSFIDINKEYQAIVNLIYLNSEIPIVPYLYLEVKNNDIKATGDIELEMIFKTEWVE